MRERGPNSSGGVNGIRQGREKGIRQGVQIRISKQKTILATDLRNSFANRVIAHTLLGLGRKTERKIESQNQRKEITEGRCDLGKGVLNFTIRENDGFNI